jgi:hypothetical protein
MHILFAHVTSTSNVGDLVAGPYRYFQFEGATHDVVSTRDLSAAHARRADAIIIGGGAVAGAVKRVWEASKRPHIVAWGVGQTKHGAMQRYVSPFARLYDLYGSRELPLVPNEKWVPCASCMHPSIDKYRGAATQRHAGVYFNSDPSIIGRYPMPDSLRRLPKRSNRVVMEDAISFLASTEVILTNSYHGAYWGQLLGRRVILVNAYSAKFFGYQYQPPVWDGVGDWSHLIPEAAVPSDMLEESRLANTDFHAEVLNLLETK